MFQNNGRHLNRQGGLVTAPQRHLDPDLVATHRAIVDRQGQLQLLAVPHRARVEGAGRAQGLLLLKRPSHVKDLHFDDIYSVLRIRDVYPGSRILIFTYPGSRISDPKTATKERGEKNWLSYLFM